MSRNQREIVRAVLLAEEEIDEEKQREKNLPAPFDVLKGDLREQPMVLRDCEPQRRCTRRIKVSRFEPDPRWKQL